ncbi:heterokaryon incompatibility protein-domain-containing protein, partial [Phaeosphaeriaceae sp. PMI808]
MDFCYQPLDPKVKEIRIFKIHPRNSSYIRKLVGGLTKACAIPLLELTLTHVRLDKAELVFNALSYTWGEPSPMRKVLINNQIFKIRESLWHFLNVAAQDPEIHNKQIWVDQISINQASIEERNHQVGLMGHIYTQASKVFMWLGTSTRYCNRTMIHLSNGCISRVLKDPTRMDTEALLRIMKFYSSPKFTALLKRPYWRRLWIIQEIVL